MAACGRDLKCVCSVHLNHIIIGNVICGSTWASNGGPMTPPFELGPIRPIRAPDSDRDYHQDTFAALTAAQRGRGNHSATSLSRGGPRRERYGQLHVMLMIIIMIIRMIS